MTDVSMNLIEAVGKCGDSDLLRQLAQTALMKLMEFEVEQRIGAGRPA